MNIPKKIFTNEYLKLFSNGQIRILNKAIRILQLTLQFWSFSSKFKEADSNPSHSNLNPLFKKCKLTKAIRIHIPESSDWRRRFESLMKRFKSKFQQANWGWQIRILNQTIRIPCEERRETESHRFKFPLNDSNPSWRTWRETKVRIQIP